MYLRSWNWNGSSGRQMGFKKVHKGCSWAAVAMYNRIIIVIIVAVGKDLEGIIVVCNSLMYDWHPSDGAWSSDHIPRGGHPWRCNNCHPRRCGSPHPQSCIDRGWGIGFP